MGRIILEFNICVNLKYHKMVEYIDSFDIIQTSKFVQNWQLNFIKCQQGVVALSVIPSRRRLRQDDHKFEATWAT